MKKYIISLTIVGLVFISNNTIHAQKGITTGGESEFIKKNTSERPQLEAATLKGQNPTLQALIKSTNKATMELLNAYYEQHKTLLPQLKKSLFTDYNNALKQFIKTDNATELQSALSIIIQKALAAVGNYFEKEQPSATTTKFIKGFTMNAQTAATSYADLVIEDLKQLKGIPVTNKIQELEKLKTEMSKTTNLEQLRKQIGQIQLIIEQKLPYLPGQVGTE